MKSLDPKKKKKDPSLEDDKVQAMVNKHHPQKHVLGAVVPTKVNKRGLSISGSRSGGVTRMQFVIRT